MFNLFSDRGYKSYIQDTLHFMKLYGKNYVLNFFLINIVFILINAFVGHYFLSSFRDDLLAGKFSKMLFEYGLFALVYYLFSMTVFSFPPIYARLLVDREDKTLPIHATEILKEYKSILGKMFKFHGYLILWIFLFLIGIVLCIVTLIGIPALLILIPFFFVWMQFSYYNYLYHNVPLTKSMGVSYKLLKKDFWPIAGSFLALILITTILGTVFGFIPLGFEYIASITTSSGEFSWAKSLTENNSNLLIKVYTDVINAFFMLIQLTAIIIMFFTQQATQIKVANEIDQIGS